jgi:hypothetical protein
VALLDPHSHRDQLRQLLAQAAVVVADQVLDQLTERTLVPALGGGARILALDLGEDRVRGEAALGAGVGERAPAAASEVQPVPVQHARACRVADRDLGQREHRWFLSPSPAGRTTGSLCSRRARPEILLNHDDSGVRCGSWAAAARELGLHRANLHHLAQRLVIKPKERSLHPVVNASGGD